MSTDKPPSSSADASEPSRAESGTAGGRVIKRYSNRKLYDTRTKRYLTLEEVGVLVKVGENIRVEDSDTGDDLTATVLAKIIADGSRKPCDVCTKTGTGAAFSSTRSARNVEHTPLRARPCDS